MKKIIFILFVFLLLGTSCAKNTNKEKTIVNKTSTHQEDTGSIPSGNNTTPSSEIIEPSNPTEGTFIPGGEVQPDPLMYSSVTLDKDEYNLGETVNITLKLFFRGEGVIERYPEYIGEGDVYVKIDSSPLYDVIGSSEQKYEDFSYEKNIKNSSTNQVIFNFQIVFKENVSTYDLYKYIIFRLKFNYNLSEAMDNISELRDCYSFINKDDEYFIVLPELAYIIDDGVVRIVRTYYYEEQIGILFYNNMNKKYDEGKISKDEYLESLRAFICNEMVYVKIDKDYIYYISRNIYAKININKASDDIINDFNNGELEEVANGLLLIMFNYNKIDEDKLNKELEYLNTNSTTNHISYPETWRLTKDLEILCEDKMFGLPLDIVIN